MGECACAHPFTRVICACRAREDDTCVICQVQGQSREVMAPTALPRAMESALRGAKMMREARRDGTRRACNREPRYSLAFAPGYTPLKDDPTLLEKQWVEGAPKIRASSSRLVLNSPCPRQVLVPVPVSVSVFFFFFFSVIDDDDGHHHHRRTESDMWSNSNSSGRSSRQEYRFSVSIARTRDCARACTRYKSKVSS